VEEKGFFSFYILQSIQINDSEKKKPKSFDPTAGKWTQTAKDTQVARV